MSAPGIELDAICFRIGSWGMDRFNLSLGAGEYLVLSGPNGAGKTLLLKLICGLYRPESGAIRLHGRDVTALPPWQREVGYVPQDGLLFPHCDVRSNIAFGLTIRGVSRAAKADAVKHVADLLRIQPLLERRPQGLSGGERQRVCLARALILEPKILLLDEPVSAIDESARDALCQEIRAIQHRLHITTIHISHNSHETGLVADRIGSLDGGRLISMTPAPALSARPDSANRQEAPCS